MRQQVVLKIKGYPVKVDLIYGSRVCNKYHFCFGVISAKITKNISLKRIEDNLNRAFSEKIVSSFNQEPFIDGNYAYILGEIERVYPKDDSNTFESIYVRRNGKNISAKKFFLEVLKQRVAYYEKIIGLGSHTIKVRYLSAVLGNNHYGKKVLTFNQYLLHFDINLIDQVIIHELCHDIHHNHSKAFYETLSKYCPDYAMRKQKLINGVRR